MAIASLPGQPWISGEVLCCSAVGDRPQDLHRGSFAMSLEPDFQSLRALGRALLSHLVLKGAGQLCLPADDACELIPVGVGQWHLHPSSQPDVWHLFSLGVESHRSTEGQMGGGVSLGTVLTWVQVPPVFLIPLPCPWASGLIASLCFSLLICKVGLIIISAL